LTTAKTVLKGNEGVPSVPADGGGGAGGSASAVKGMAILSLIKEGGVNPFYFTFF
jgi:hypothetical protein